MRFASFARGARPARQGHIAPVDEDLGEQTGRIPLDAAHKFNPILLFYQILCREGIRDLLPPGRRDGSCGPFPGARAIKKSGVKAAFQGSQAVGPGLWQRALAARSRPAICTKGSQGCGPACQAVAYSPVSIRSGLTSLQLLKPSWRVKTLLVSYPRLERMLVLAWAYFLPE